MENAAKKAVNSPLLEVSIDGARGILFTISGSEDLTMKEVDEGARLITKAADPEAQIIFGAVIDENLRKGEVKATVIAAGLSNIPEIKPKNYIQPPKIEEEEPQKENEWDIPAFLRKKGVKKKQK